jgi:hypothetical protein
MENEIKEKLYISEKEFIFKPDNEIFTNYILELDDLGLPGVRDDEMLVVPRYTNLCVKIYKNNYRDLKLVYQDSLGKIYPLELENEPCICYFNIKLSTPGPFKFILSNGDSNLSEFFIIVEPKAYINEKEVHLDGIQIQTVLSKSLGKITNWESHYKECDYLSIIIVNI